MTLFIAIFPIVLLIYLMTKRKNWPSYKALPVAALLLYFIKVFYFDSSFREVNAALIDGLLTAWTPILVIWGAIFLFHTMENTGEMTVIRKWLDGITHNQVAQLMIIGWAFAFLLEGASGFGTPAAIAAPILVGLGFRPLQVAMLTLVMNSVPVTFGAVGTPVWFGLGQLGLSQVQLLEIGIKSAMIHSVAALIIPILALRFVVSWKDIKKNIGFIYLSILSCVFPYLLMAHVGYEFPSIVGGFVGLILSIILAKKGVGMAKERRQKSLHFSAKTIVKATFALWGTAILLLLTRIEPLKIKALLNSTAHSLGLNLKPFAEFLISPALVIQVKDILETGRSVTHALLYVPSIIPFFFISGLTFILFKTKKGVIKKTWSQSWQQIKKPILSLVPALVLVKLLLMDGDHSIVILIGQALAQITGTFWQYLAAYLGALGSFFSGSNTVSNLTFAGIQESIAQNLNLNLTTILAAQSVGGAMGNMVCINNIVAVCSVLGLVNKEGEIIKKTLWPMLIYGVVAGVMTMFL